MIIDVQSAKGKATEVDPAEAYQLRTGQNKSSGPLYLGLFLSGVALYLKSIFPGGARPAEPAPNANEGETPSDPKSAKPLAAAGEAKSLKPETTSPIAPIEAAKMHASAVVELFPEEPFKLDNSRTLEFTNFKAKPDFDPFQTSPVIPRPTNDNAGGGQGGTGGGNAGAGDGHAKPTQKADERTDEPAAVKLPPVPKDVTGIPAGPKDNDAEEPAAELPPVPKDDVEEPSSQKNRSPRTTGPVYLRDVAGCAGLVIALSDLLQKAEDPDGDILTVRNIKVSSGTLTQADGGWLFEGDGLGPVTITYEITDGEFIVQQTASFSVVAQPPVIGTQGDDALLGRLCADEIDGRGGNDNIDGRSGHDVIAGGAGDDHIIGGDGDDVIFAGAGDDIVFGGNGNDRISGGDGNDRLIGEGGDDIIFADAGADFVSGGDGGDILFGGSGDDVVYGDAGDDIIEGEAGNDQLLGGSGDDRIAGGDGNDLIEAGDGDDILRDGKGVDIVRSGAGSDVIFVALDQENDRLDGGIGFDTLNYSTAEQAVSVDLGRETASSAETGDDQVLAFEKVVGGSGADSITGSADDNILIGGAGNDYIAGAGGADIIDGQGGDDVLRDGDGSDAVQGGTENDTVVAAFDSTNDSFDGGAGTDTLDYSSSTGDLILDLAQGRASGQEIGTDTILSFETILGGRGDDRFVVGDKPVTLAGGAGENEFIFAAPAASSSPEPAILMHEIVDFKPSDLIRMSKYDIFEKVLDELDDQFQAIYDAEIDEDDVGIRYRQERVDQIDRTVIEADLDHDHVFETTISLHGNRALVIVESVPQSLDV